MRQIVLSQRKERDGLLEKTYLLRDYQTEAEKFLASPLIKLITGPRRAGKSVLTLLLLKRKNFTLTGSSCLDLQMLKRTGRMSSLASEFQRSD